MSDDTPPPKTRMTTRKKLTYAFLCLILCLSVSFTVLQIGAKGVEYTEETLPVAPLHGLSGLRILVFSDLHSNYAQLEEAVELAQDKKPDLIFFLGDLYTDYTRASRGGDYINQLKRLSALAPCYAILGNHDIERIDKFHHIMKHGGFTVLRNEARAVVIPRLNNASVTLIGLGDYGEGDCLPETCMDKDKRNPAPVILLSHNPKSREILNDYRWHLMLCGHTHGGQIKLPFCRPLLLKSGEHMAEGLYPFEDRHIYVTPGIGYHGPGRFNCPAQINMLIIP